MSLFRRWGFGAELVFDAGRATLNMTKAQRSVKALRSSFMSLRESGSRLGSSLTTMGTLLAPLGIGFGLAAAKASSLAGNLEAQKLTMRVLIGDLGKANDLLAMIRENASATPFTEGDLIEGSKRLLRLTGDNIDKNMDLLKMMETMAALSPGKSVVDAVEGLLDATSGGGFERLKEFGFALRAEDFKAAGKPGGEAWAEAVVESMRATLKKKTKGEDLVAALAETFGGRLSTLQDAIENVLKPIGTALNEALKPALVAVTTLINDSADDLSAGFTNALAFMMKAWDRFGAPVWLSFLAAWDSIGSKGRQVAGLLLGLFGAFTAAILPVGGALGISVIAMGAMVTGVSALIPLATAAWTAITGISLGAVALAATVGLIVGALAAGLAFLAGTFGTLATRSGNLGVIWEGMQAMMEGARFKFHLLRNAAQAFFAGFMEQVAPLVRTMLEELQPAFNEVVLAVGSLFEELGFVGSGMNGIIPIALFLGRAIGGALGGAFETATFAMQGMLELGRFVLPLFELMIIASRRMVAILIGFAGGTLTAGEGFKLLVLTMQQGILTVMGVLVGTILRVIQRVLASLADLPGLKGLVIGAKLRDASARVGQLGGDLSDQFDKKIARVDASARELEGQRAAGAAPVVNVNPETTVEAKLEAQLCVDGQEVARATGATAVRAGERGTGPPLPAQQRGRVLRRGLVVEPLRPAEAF